MSVRSALPLPNRWTRLTDSRLLVIRLNWLSVSFWAHIKYFFFDWLIMLQAVEIKSEQMVKSTWKQVKKCAVNSVTRRRQPKLNTNNPNPNTTDPNPDPDRNANHSSARLKRPSDTFIIVVISIALMTAFYGPGQTVVNPVSIVASVVIMVIGFALLFAIVIVYFLSEVFRGFRWEGSK